MTRYDEFVHAKLAIRPPVGLTGEVSLPDSLFPHQKALTSWALKRGRAAIFADTGLGKTRMEIAWADVVSRTTESPVVIVAPLAVAAPITAEGERIGINVHICRGSADKQA